MNHKTFLCGALLLASISGVDSAERGEVAPQTLPMKWSSYLETMSSSEGQLPSTVLPEAMTPFMKGSSLDVALEITDVKEEVFVVSPMTGKGLLEKEHTLKVWDKLMTGEKGVVELETDENVQWVLGANSALQVFSTKEGRPILRLLKGKLRVVSTSEEPVSIETLNSHIKIFKSTVDIKISAMNTLIAPRDGEDVDVLTRKAHQSVPVGTYGLVMADGALVFTGGKGKK